MSIERRIEQVQKINDAGNERITVEINPRQQAKIIRILESGDFSWFDVEDGITLRTDEREDVLRKLRQGEITERQLANFLEEIYLVYEEEEKGEQLSKVFDRVMGDKHMSGIIAEFALDDFDQRKNIKPEDIVTLLKLYPEPISLLAVAEPFLKNIEKYNGLGRQEEYRKSLFDLMRLIYGKRFEYWQQIELLIEEARGKHNSSELDKPELEENNKFSIEVIDKDRGLEILNRVEIHGDPFNDKLLSKEILKEQGLLPKYRVRLGDSFVWLSSLPYDIKHGRIAVVGYVEIENRIIARSYYLSNSTGLWRYLPGYLSQKGKIVFYDKGYDQQSVTLPSILQRALSEISKEGGEILSVEDPFLIFAGTAGRIAKESSYIAEVDSAPQNLRGDFYRKSTKKRIPPEELNFDNLENDPDYPDYSKLITSWKQNTKLYGEIDIEAYPSNDGHLKFLLCRDRLNRVWLGGIETGGKIQSTGLKQSWVDGGDLTTPAYEYKEDSNGYGNYEIESGHYVDMFQNYLSKIPMIRTYMRHNNIPLP